MKFVYSVAALALLAFSLPSCKKCTECTKFPNPAQTLCHKDFGSDESYNAAYQDLIGQGYKCD